MNTVCRMDHLVTGHELCKAEHAVLLEALLCQTTHDIHAHLFHTRIDTSRQTLFCVLPATHYSSLENRYKLRLSHAYRPWCKSWT